jgi:SlyX protein
VYFFDFLTLMAPQRTHFMNNEIIELETKIAFQEDMIQALNRTLAEQQQELVELKRDIEELQTQLRALAPSLSPTTTDETPPHY